MDEKEEYSIKFTSGWTEELLKNMSKECETRNSPEAIKDCANYHYRSLDMDKILDRYVGDLEGFLKFLTETWGWIVECDLLKQEIIANENKEFCVCPVKESYKEGQLSSLLCNCSEGFAERIFSKVTGKKVHAKVINSILQGDKNCIYRIML